MALPFCKSRDERLFSNTTEARIGTMDKWAD